MPSVFPKYPKEEFALRGQAMYAELIEPLLRKKDRGRFVAIDLESGEFEIADRRDTAVFALRDRLPEAQIWVERVGFPAAVKFGTWLRGGSK